MTPLALATELAPHWESRGLFSAGRETLEALLAEGGGAPAERAEALGALATLAMAQGDAVAAQDAHARAVELHEELGARRSAAASRSALAMAQLAAGDAAGAAASSEAALSVMVHLGDIRGEAFARSGGGLVAAESGDVQRDAASLSDCSSPSGRSRATCRTRSPSWA